MSNIILMIHKNRNNIYKIVTSHKYIIDLFPTNAYLIYKTLFVENSIERCQLE